MIKEFFMKLFGKKQEQEQKQEEPIRPAESKMCGCGRSPSGVCVGYHALTLDEWEKKKLELNPAKPVADKPKRARKQSVKQNPVPVAKKSAAKSTATKKPSETKPMKEQKSKTTKTKK
jgi:hypothetical protein